MSQQSNLSQSGKRSFRGKQLLSIIIMICMIVTMMPVPVGAVETKFYDIWVGGIQVSDYNKDDVLGDGTVQYTPAEGEEPQALVLDGAIIQGGFIDDESCEEPSEGFGIFTSDSLELRLVEGTENTVSGAVYGSQSQESGIGICVTEGSEVSNVLTITGEGKLKAIGGSADVESMGIYVHGDMFVTASTQVEAECGNSIMSYGVYIKGSESQLLVEGSLIARGGASPDVSYGIYADNDIIVNGSGNIEAEARDTSGESIGIFCGEITINDNSTVKAISGAGEDMSYGIANINPHVDGIIITGGTLEAFSHNTDRVASDTNQALSVAPSFQGHYANGNYQVIAGANSNDSTTYESYSDVPEYSQYVKIEPIQVTEPDTEPEIWVAGMKVTSDNQADVLGDGKVRYTPAIGDELPTLTLEDMASYMYANSSYRDEEGNVYGIYIKGDLNLELIGDNSIIATGSSNGEKDGVGVYSTGDLTISGTGKLIATGGYRGSQGDTGDSYGVRLEDGDLTIRGTTLLAAGAPAIGNRSGSYGIRVNGNMNIVDGGYVEAYHDVASYVSAAVFIDGQGSSLNVEGSSLFSGGFVEESMNNAPSAYSYGIKFYDKSLTSLTSLNIDNGIVFVLAESATIESIGIDTNAVHVYGDSVLSVESSSAGETSYGINSDSMIINGGLVEAASGEAAISSQAMKVTDLTFVDTYIYEITAGSDKDDAIVVTNDVFNNSVDSYKYILIESKPIVQIGDVDYSSLQDAVNAVGDGETINLLVDIDLDKSISTLMESTNNFTINLNGHTLDGGEKPAIWHLGTGVLTIVDDANGKVTSANPIFGTIVTAGSLEVLGGTVENTYNQDIGGIAINNIGDGDIVIMGDAVIRAMGTDAHAIFNTNSADVYIAEDANVSTSGEEACTIHNVAGHVNIAGGTVMATGERAIAIFNESSSEVNVSAGTVSANGMHSVAIFSAKDGDVIVYGGLISATGTESVGIFADKPNTISIPTGSPIIKGEGMAMNEAPNLTNYTRVKVIASQHVSGTPVVTYNPSDIMSYKYLTFTTQSSSGGSGGSTGGSSSSNNSSITITLPPVSEPNRPTQAEIKVTGTVNSEGIVTVNITDKILTEAYDKALAEAKKNGKEANGISVVLNVDAGDKTVDAVTVNLPKDIQDTIIAKKIVSVIIMVNQLDITVGMDLATVQEINKQAQTDVTITADRIENNTLTEEAKQAIGSRPVFDLKVSYGNGKLVQNFGSGNVLLTIPYTLGVNEKAENVVAVYVDGNGKVQWLDHSVYNRAEKTMTINTDHFSIYGIGYKQDRVTFTDIVGHWAEEDIECVVDKGLFKGTSATTFSPNIAMTRGMFVTVLGRLANADVNSYKQSSFTDVKGESYYVGYIEWARTNNIVNGIGNGKFAPEQSITREQMAVIMSNYAKVMNQPVEQSQSENVFADHAKISVYAKDAVKQMQMAGILSGKNNNIFDPQGTATRAEVSAVLHRFVELANDDHTK